MKYDSEDFKKRVQTLALSTTLPEICEALLVLVDRVETLEKKVARMSKKKDKIKPSKTVEYICNDALYYQRGMIATHHDRLKVTRKPEGYIEVVVENNDIPCIYQVNEATWKLWVKEVRVVKVPDKVE